MATTAEALNEARRALRTHGARLIRYENELAGKLLARLIRAGGRPTPALDDLVAGAVGTPHAAKVLALVPEPRRGRAISRWMWTQGYERVREIGVPLLRRFPSKTAARALLADRDFVEDDDRPIAELEEIDDAGVQSELRAWKRKRMKFAALAKQPALKLRCRRSWTPKSVAALTAIQKKQLAEMADGYDGMRIPLAKRFEKDGPAESLVFREIVDAKGEHVYDIVTWLADDGCAFVAGTTKEVANLVQHEVECDDPRLAEALRKLIG